MKTSRFPFLLGAGAAFFLTLAFAAVAQPSATPAEPATPATPAATAAASDDPTKAAVPPAPPAAPVSPAPADPTVEPRPPEAATADTAEPPLRRIDKPDTPSSPSPAKSRRSPNRRGNAMPMGDHHVPKGSEVHDAVSILGSTKVEGNVNGDAVAVLGSTSIGPDAKVRGAAVAILGKLDVQGQVGQEAVSVLGGVNIDGEVRNEAVAVLGSMRLGPTAVVHGDVVVVLGKLSRDPGAIVEGDVVNVPGFGGIGDVEWLTTWFKRCVLLGRPLAFGENLGWAWVIAFSFLGLYLLLALLFPRGIERCAETMETRPGYSIVASMLTVLLTPVVIVLLLFTVVGALLVPFVMVGLLFASFFGKAVMLAWLGRRAAAVFGSERMGHGALAVLIGGVIVLGLYVVPVLGFLVFKLLSWLGLGVVLYTVALKLKREKRPTPPGAPVPPAGPPVPPTAGPATAMTSPPAAAAAVTGPPAVASFSEQSPGFSGNPPAADAAAGFVSGAPIPVLAGVPPVPAAAAPVPPLPAATAIGLPRASFFLRMAALVLDIVLVAVVAGFLSDLLPRALRFGSGPPSLLILLALYGAIMWKIKGTTIGGIICGLKVTRLDGREMDWPTAIVRALGCFLSLIVVGLGFLWIAIDDERQSWHDKIAGTIVVRLPKGMSLL